MGKDRDSNVLNKVSAPVTDSLILICEKCGKKLSFSDDPDANPAKALQRAIKDEAKSRFGKGKIRPVITGCLDICPKNEVATAIVRVDGSGRADEFYTIEARDLKEACQTLIDRAIASD